MNTKSEIKNVIIGLIIGILITVCIGATTGPKDEQYSGRYQITGTEKWGLVIDTKTGQVWRQHFEDTGGRVDGDFFKRKN